MKPTNSTNLNNLNNLKNTLERNNFDINKLLFIKI